MDKKRFQKIKIKVNRTQTHPVFTLFNLISILNRRIGQFQNSPPLPTWTECERAMTALTTAVVDSYTPSLFRSSRAVGEGFRSCKNFGGKFEMWTEEKSKFNLYNINVFYFI